MDYKLHSGRAIRNVFSIPFVWMMIFPLVFLDILLEIYHFVCFSLYGLKFIDRSRYIRIDRQKLSYLGLVDKVNCMYCGYANGLLSYASTIAGETERYWCGIKHKQGNGFIEPKHQTVFLEYGDEEAYKKKYTK